jgi:hypothetical protein
MGSTSEVSVLLFLASFSTLAFDSFAFFADLPFVFFVPFTFDFLLANCLSSFPLSFILPFPLLLSFPPSFLLPFKLPMPCLLAAAALSGPSFESGSISRHSTSTFLLLSSGRERTEGLASVPVSTSIVVKS